MSFENDIGDDSPPQTQSARRLPSNLGRYHDGKWYCDCQDFDCLAKPWKAGEKTPNRNKKFWRCPKSPDNQCRFFLWVEDENKRKERLVSYGLLDIPPPKTPTSTKRPREDDSGLGRSLENPWSLSKRKPEPIYVPDDDEPGSPLSQTIVPDEMEDCVDPNTPSRKARKRTSISTPHGTAREGPRRASQSMPTPSGKGKQPITVASGSGHRARDEALPHLTTSRLSTTVLDLLRSENLELDSTTVVKLCHTIHLEMVQHKAVVEQYEKAISELS